MAASKSSSNKLPSSASRSLYIVSLSMWVRRGDDEHDDYSVVVVL